MINNVHICGRDPKLADSDPLVEAHLYGVVDVQLSIVLKPGMESETQESPFISFPRRRQHSLCEVQKRLLQLRLVREIHPHQADLLGDKEPVGAVVGVHHSQRVLKSVSKFLQAQLEATFCICGNSSQVFV